MPSRATAQHCSPSRRFRSHPRGSMVRPDDVRAVHAHLHRRQCAAKSSAIDRCAAIPFELFADDLIFINRCYQLLSSTAQTNPKRHMDPSARAWIDGFADVARSVGLLLELGTVLANRKICRQPNFSISRASPPAGLPLGGCRSGGDSGGVSPSRHLGILLLVTRLDPAPNRKRTTTIAPG